MAAEAGGTCFPYDWPHTPAGARLCAHVAAEYEEVRGRPAPASHSWRRHVLALGRPRLPVTAGAGTCWLWSATGTSGGSARLERACMHQACLPASMFPPAPRTQRTPSLLPAPPTAVCAALEAFGRGCSGFDATLITLARPPPAGCAAQASGARAQAPRPALLPMGAARDHRGGSSGSAAGGGSRHGRSRR